MAADPEVLRLAAERVSQIAEQVQRGEAQEDMAERCANYYANALGIPVEDVRAARSWQRRPDGPNAGSCRGRDR
ncbi:hypothetical protein [Streptomyces sp. NPDC097640]|uniref:hypothetical protein n=1 Tax=Streptomyces sp. NPDC097640 TaxID=3157229 RepID=UPI00332E3FCA